MPRMFYQKIKLGVPKLEIIRGANTIIAKYRQDGYDLTLRQLYYQFVARDLFPESWKDPETKSTNNMKSYKRLQDIIGDGRMCGLIDWEAIVDRTRFVRTVSTWDNPADIINSCVRSFKTDKWKNQDYRPEVWVEKDALVGVVEPVCNELELPFLACRGYTSMSEIWSSARRMFAHLKAGKKPIVLHLGDMDPSGVDMTRDIKERFETFVEMDWMREVMKPGEASVTRGAIWADIERVSGIKGIEVRRLALNMDQVEQYNPPPNPAKTTDSRFEKFREEYGDDSWELDALDPSVISGIIRDEIERILDGTQWKIDYDRQERMRSQLKGTKDHWEEVVEYMVDNDMITEHESKD